MTPEQTYQLVEITKIDDPERSMRLDLNEDNLRELSSSIRDYGIIEPLVLRRKGDRFEVIAGHRRLAAAFIVRLREVPAVVRDSSDRETTILRVHENLIREDVDVVSEAHFFAQSIKDLSLTIQEFAKMIHRSDAYIYDRLAIAEMPEFLQDALKEKAVPLGIALALQDLDDDELKYKWLMSAIENGLTVRSLRDAIREHKNLLARVESGELAPLPPSHFDAPPIVIYPCARCGERHPLERLKIVRICIDDCVVE